ncbi:MAG: thioredoxin domain-containing protein [Lentisphaerae bacterium]|nr:thioredoxin domain-containing protein [Lentisphaerota bacterium]
MQTSRVTRVFIVGLAMIALAIAFYIMLVVKSDSPMPGCGEDQCNAVLTSRWEHWGIVPVAYLGIGGYVSLMSATLLSGFMRWPLIRMGIWSLMIVESLTGIGFIAWLLLLQWIIIKQFCIFCLSSHLFGVAAYGIVLWKAPTWQGFHHARRRLTGTATALLTVLIAVHVLAVPDMMAVQTAESLEPTSHEEEAALSHGTFQFGKQDDTRVVNLLNKTLSFDLYKVPVTGSRAATYVLLDISDYSCPSCRTLHAKLKEFNETYDISLAIVQLPAPMNSGCNPDIKKTPHGFENACAYARYAMAVNKADPEQFPAYHDYLMSGRYPPPVNEARARAAELIGQEAFETALRDEAVEEWITNGVNLKRYVKATTLPRLITPTQVISYSGGSNAGFAKLMQKALGITELTKRP